MDIPITNQLIAVTCPGRDDVVKKIARVTPDDGFVICTEGFNENNPFIAAIIEAGFHKVK